MKPATWWILWLPIACSSHAGADGDAGADSAESDSNSMCTPVADDSGNWVIEGSSCVPCGYPGANLTMGYAFWAGTGTSGVDPSLNLENATIDQQQVLCDWVGNQLAPSSACATLALADGQTYCAQIFSKVRVVGCTVADFEDCTAAVFTHWCPCNSPSNWDPVLVPSCLNVMACEQ